MNTSRKNIEWITPAVFESNSNIRAWFTLKNAWMGSERLVSGLNLGLNTPENEETVLHNRELLFDSLDVDPDWVVYGEQVHGTRVRTVTEGGMYPETDGLVTQVPGLSLAIQVADCAAVLLGDSVNGIVAAVHAGWRGAAGGILPLAIDRMIDMGAEAGKINAFVSPCISLQNFEVGEEVAEQFPDNFVDRERFSKPHVDLKGFLFSQMSEMGMISTNIEVHKGCTMNDDRQFYSFRREQQKSGRMMGLIQLNR